MLIPSSYWTDFCARLGAPKVLDATPSNISGALLALSVSPKADWYRYNAVLRDADQKETTLTVDILPNLDSWRIQKDGEIIDARLSVRSGELRPIFRTKIETTDPTILFNFRQLRDMWGGLYGNDEDAFCPRFTSIANDRFVYVLSGRLNGPESIEEGYYTELIVDSWKGYAVYYAETRMGEQQLSWRMDSPRVVPISTFPVFLRSTQDFLNSLHSRV